ncbi:MAG: glycoside hydrolase family 9 protein [Bacillota bacterium]
MKKSIILFILALLALAFINEGAAQPVYIRVNQLGFIPGDLKTGVVLSNKKLDGKQFSVKEYGTDKTVYSGMLQKSSTGNQNFRFTYLTDFSSIKSNGRYYLSVDGAKSIIFRIGQDVYNAAVDSLMMFFRVQRCGYTDPLEHSVCHPDDASRVMNGSKAEMGKVDMTGGWHDAGDYVKFLNTAAYTTYTLMFAYDFDPVRFGFDNNKNNVPDILEEAKTGLDWLLRLNYAKNKLVTQIQDMRDHDQGWRLPESDQLANDRPAFTGIGKNVIGIYSATLSLAARIWKERLHYNEFSDKCLKVAKEFYALRNSVPDLDKTQSGMYQDTKYAGKLALAAAELYLTTRNRDYLSDAENLADRARSDFWWSWGDINSYAHYRLASVDSRFKNYIFENIKLFNDKKNKDLFGAAAENSWGSNNAVLGAALQAILWKRLTGDSSFDSLSIFQRDYILGKNQWGISFIQGVGTIYPRNFHSQLAYFKHGYLPGAVAAGPVSKDKLQGYKIKLAQNDKLKQFQTDNAVYHDDRMDFITNEPTIAANATAVFVMGYYSNRK